MGRVNQVRILNHKMSLITLVMVTMGESEIKGNKTLS